METVKATRNDVRERREVANEQWDREEEMRRNRGTVEWGGRFIAPGNQNTKDKMTGKTGSFSRLLACITPGAWIKHTLFAIRTTSKRREAWRPPRGRAWRGREWKDDSVKLVSSEGKDARARRKRTVSCLCIRRGSRATAELSSSFQRFDDTAGIFN